MTMTMTTATTKTLQVANEWKKREKIGNIRFRMPFQLQTQHPVSVVLLHRSLAVGKCHTCVAMRYDVLREIRRMESLDYPTNPSKAT